VKLPLPLTWEIVTADVSRSDNEGAWRIGRGGGWAIKDASCGKHGDLEVGGQAEGWFMWGGPRTRCP